MILPAAGKGLKQTKYPGSKNFVEFPRVALTERSVKETIACVAGFKRGRGRGRGNLGARARGAREGERKGTPARTPSFSPFFTLRF